MTKNIRLYTFLFLAFLIIIFFKLISDGLFIPDSIKILLFSSSIMLVFFPLILEHYYTKPTDILATSLSILLTVGPLRQELSEKMGLWYWLYVGWIFLLCLTSILIVFLLDANEPPTSKKNRYSNLFKSILIKVGNTKAQFYILSIITMLFYLDAYQPIFLSIFLFSTFMLIDPWKIVLKIKGFSSNESKIEGIGQLVGVQCKNTFLIKLYKTRSSIKIYDLVEFTSRTQNGKSTRGLIIDNYVSEEEQWIKVLSSKEIDDELTTVDEIEDKKLNIIYKLDSGDCPKFLSRFVGLVQKNTSINRIQFLYSSSIKIQEGQLFEILVGEDKVLYQLVEGTIKSEYIEKGNETGFIIGDAVQLGVWDSKNSQFEKFGWVPNMNAPIFLASRIPKQCISGNELEVGTIPETNYPVIIDKSLAVTHHLAVLGVTGTGKSVFSRNLIKEYCKDNMKVICVDFTGEYKKYLKDLNPLSVITDSDSKKLFDKIDWKHEELSKFQNQRDRNQLDKNDREIMNLIKTNIRMFFEDSDKNIALFELPDVENTNGIFDYTRYFFKSLFEIAKNDKNFGNKVCVVLEEAHTVIPEWNFSSTSDKSSQSLVNSIGQIALQGRKYDIGFLVIAQRTANVSKTILTQCNSVVVFQEFDKTSGEFLSNYLGPEFVQSLKNLKFRQAIAVGKAFKSNVPMIFEVPEIEENSD